MTKGWIFDYGGTLDTGGQHWGQAMWHAYERHRVPVSEQQFREAYVHVERLLGQGGVIGADWTFRQTLDMKLRLQLERLFSVECRVESGEFATAEEPALVPASPSRAVVNSTLSTLHSQLLNDLYARTVSQTARSRQVLGRLREQGAQLVLVSNFYGNIDTVLREFGLDSLFAAVVESARVGIRKPDPRIFLLGVEALHLEPGAVTVVGDSLEKDIAPARTAGCRTVWLKGEGWNGTSQGDDPRPDLVIGALEELL